MDLSAATIACDRFEGIAYRFVQNKKWNTANHVIGAVRLARNWGASTEQINQRVQRVRQFAYQPDPARIAELGQIVESIVQSSGPK